MKKLYQTTLLILLLVSSISVFGQQKNFIDSLTRELDKQQTDTGRIKIMMKLSKCFHRSDSSKALFYIYKAREIAKRINAKQEIATLYYYEGKVYHNYDKFSKATGYYEKALEIYRSLGNLKMLAGMHLELGCAYLDISDYTNGLENLTQSLELYKKTGINSGMACCYASMGVLYSRQKDYKSSIEYTQKSISLTTSELDKALMYSNISMDLKKMGDYAKSISYFDSIVPILKRKNDFIGLSTAYLNFGESYAELNNYNKAREYYKTSLQYARQLENLTYILNAQASLSDLYVKMNQPDSAIILMKQGVEINKKLNSKKLPQVLYRTISLAYEKKGDYKQALEYHKKYKEAADTISKQLSDKKLLEVQTKWEVDKKNEQIKLLAKDKKIATQRFIILGIGLISVIIATLCIFIYKHRKTKEKQLLHEAELKDATYQIDLKHRELIHKAINLSQKEEILANIRQQLENIKIENTRGKETLLNILSDIDLQMKYNSMEDFEKYFIEVHPEFYQNLKHKYSELTQTELRVCALLRLNLNSKEIADLTHKTIRSVEATRASIRKKMGLSKENLFDIIAAI